MCPIATMPHLLASLLIFGAAPQAAEQQKPATHKVYKDLDPSCDDPVGLTVDPVDVVHRIDEKIYGHFLEHIYPSVNGGLWGALVWDRSSEGGGGPLHRQAVRP